MKLEPIYNNDIAVHSSINSSIMKVCHLKAILEDLPDDMLVVIPNNPDENYHIVSNCVYVGTAGILSSKYEPTKVLCLNAINDKNDKISKQVDGDSIKCEKTLF